MNVFRYNADTDEDVVPPRRRQLLKRFHPKGIPWPASVFYNRLSRTGIFLRHYQLVARDVARYGPAERVLDVSELKALGSGSDYAVEGTRFTGALCCLVLRKGAASASDTERRGP